MSTVREHLGFLWLLRHKLMTTNPQYDRHWEMQAALFVGVHLDELIALAGGADIEDAMRKHFPEIPSDFPRATPPSPSTALMSEREAIDLLRDALEHYARLAPNTITAREALRLTAHLAPSTASEVGELPPLPEPTGTYAELDDFGNVVSRASGDYTEKQMRAYGQECARAALAAKTAEGDEQISLALRYFMGAAYVVDTAINQRGYNWSEAYLDQARAFVLSLTASRGNTQPSTGEVDVEAERGLFEAEFPNVDWQEGATEPRDEAGKNRWYGWLAARRTKAEGAKDMVRKAFKELVKKHTHRRPRIVGNDVEYRNEIDTYQIGRDVIDAAIAATQPTYTPADGARCANEHRDLRESVEADMERIRRAAMPPKEDYR